MIDTVWQAAESISTGDIVVTSTAFDRGIAKAVSGRTDIVGISQVAIASGAIGLIRVFGPGLVNVGSNVVTKGSLIIASVTGGIGITAPAAAVRGQIAGMALSTGTGLISVFIQHI
ncbi:MAG: hypothetical protein QXI49_05370 [Candidatus Methanomethylicaceae archaeon]